MDQKRGSHDDIINMPSRGQGLDPSESRHSGMRRSSVFNHPPAYYPSNAADTRIVNAITGEKYPCKVGSKDSLRLFRVTDSSGTHDSNGYRISHRMRDSDSYVGKGANTLYYSSPQEYVQHRNNGPVPAATLEAWKERVTALCAKDETNANEDAIEIVH